MSLVEVPKDTRGPLGTVWGLQTGSQCRLLRRGGGCAAEAASCFQPLSSIFQPGPPLQRRNRPNSPKRPKPRLFEAKPAFVLADSARAGVRMGQENRPNANRVSPGRREWGTVRPRAAGQEVPAVRRE